VADLERAYHLFGSDPVQGAADGAAALGAVGSTAEDAGLDAAFEVGGIVGGHFCEQAVVGIFGWPEKRFGHAFREKKFRILLVHHGQFASEGFAVCRREHFRGLFSDLRRVDADPDAIHFGARAPERDVFIEVAGTFEHGARDRPMDVDFAAFDIFQDALIRGGLAADVVVLREAVDRDCNAHARKLHPFGGNGDHRACDNQRENIHAAENRKNAAEFLVADERLAADEGNMDRLVFSDEIDDAIDKSVATKIVELAKSGFAAEVRIAVGIAARAGERALASDFDRKHGNFAGKNISPGREDFALGDTRVGSSGSHRSSL